MAHTRTPYTKFPAKKRKLIGNDRIWTADDHILLVESTGISERYKRFYFKDIQAIQIIKTRAGFIRLAVAAALLLICVVSGSVVYRYIPKPAFLIPFMVFGVFPILYIIRQVIKGPACKCRIYSSVREEVLSPVDTLKKADKFLAVILPRIEAGQGGLLPDSDIASAKNRIAGKTGPGHGDGNIRAPRKISKTIHQILYFLLIIMGILTIASVLAHSVAVLCVMAVLSFVALAFSVVAVARQAGSFLPVRIKTVTISSLVCLIIHFFAGYIQYLYFFIVYAEKMAAISHNQWQVIHFFAGVNPFDYPVIVAIDVFFATVYFMLSAMGLIFLSKVDI